jgi:hypothetical protein
MRTKKHIYSALTLIFFAILFFASSAPSHMLKGNYQNTPYQIETTKSFDEVWSNVIDMFATKGLSIKIIDKSSGLIISDKTSFISSFTYENKEGLLIKPNAFIVINMIKSLGVVFHPTIITGEWNIRIKKNEEKTLINVNLVNINAMYTSPPTQSSPARTLNLEAKSTGVFEKIIADIIR